MGPPIRTRLAVSEEEKGGIQLGSPRTPTHDRPQGQQTTHTQTHLPVPLQAEFVEQYECERIKPGAQQQWWGWQEASCEMEKATATKVKEEARVQRDEEEMRPVETESADPNTACTAREQVLRA